MSGCMCHEPCSPLKSGNSPPGLSEAGWSPNGLLGLFIGAHNICLVRISMGA